MPRTISAGSTLTLPSDALLSPTSAHTWMNRATVADEGFYPGSPSSISPVSSVSSLNSDDFTVSANSIMKDKHRRRRRYVQRKKSMSLYHPVTPAAGFMPPRQPSCRGRELSKRVSFSDQVVIHQLPEEATDADDDKPTAMERMLEIDRLKAWVREQGENSDEGFGEDESNDWIRKLVALELVDSEGEDEQEDRVMADAA